MMLQLAILSIVLSAFIHIQLWKWGMNDKNEPKHKKPSKEVFSFQNGTFNYEEQEL